MSKRKKVSKKVSKQVFSKTGAATNSLNTRAVPMRGGFRI